ncbi:hypothetical protein [Micromonospora globispora]|uniref:hypothetical protein n=1 Tax=Micromonospora globispora TaxID=1450148 RepID=UPI001A9C61F9|nr:hypothetical protein [Micromonospora globispora]
MGELTQAFLMRTGQARDKGLCAAQRDVAYRAVLADVLCHVLLLLARRHGVDLAAEVDRKWLSRLPGGSG